MEVAVTCSQASTVKVIMTVKSLFFFSVLSLIHEGRRKTVKSKNQR